MAEAPQQLPQGGRHAFRLHPDLVPYREEILDELDRLAPDFDHRTGKRRTEDDGSTE